MFDKKQRIEKMNNKNKAIILCSDGTGNRGGFGNDSNVYKLYCAIDIHDTKNEQITHYDNGVGSNKNKILRAIGGAFGFGFKRNVCDLYEFLAKQYVPGDQIYFFGFSRGAATVRAVTGFIEACGLIDFANYPDVGNDPEATDDLINEVYDKYACRKTDPAKAADFKKDKAIHHPEYAPDGNLKIKFLGVWDTVSALGFSTDGLYITQKLIPILDDLTDKVFPHKFYNYRLNDNIEYAYQALSIDDQRKTFKPRLWRQGRGNTVEQVWFAGVHANVGGGYPRNGVSNVAMEWMMTKAEAAGLVFQTDVFQQVKAQANELGRVYDSRSGLRAYYRYQPRNITDLCSEMDIKTVNIHETVFNRMDHAISGYAPGNIPEDIEIVCTKKPTAAKKKLLTDRVKRITKNNSSRMKVLEGAKKYIENRKVLYQVLVESTLAVIALALFMDEIELPVDATNLTLTISKLLNFMLPDFFSGLINYLALNPFHLFLMVCYFGFLFYLRRHFLNETQKVHAEARKYLQ